MDSVSLNEALIAAVQKRQSLYDKSDDNYFNRVYINRQWQEIGQEIGIDDQIARKKWTTLRDYFQKTHRQLTMAQSGSGADKHRKWYLYDSMHFLLPHISNTTGNRVTTSNLSPEHQDDTVVDFKDRSYTLSPSPVPTPSESSQVGEENASAPLLRPPTKRKRRFPQDRSGANVPDEKMLVTISSIGEKLTEKEEVSMSDEDELFCRSLVSKIKSLDPFTKMECQAEIQMLILRFMRRSAGTSADRGQTPTT